MAFRIASRSCQSHLRPLHYAAQSQLREFSNTEVQEYRQNESKQRQNKAKTKHRTNNCNGNRNNNNRHDTITKKHTEKGTMAQPRGKRGNTYKINRKHVFRNAKMRTEYTCAWRICPNFICFSFSILFPLPDRSPLLLDPEISGMNPYATSQKVVRNIRYSDFELTDLSRTIG